MTVQTAGTEQLSRAPMATTIPSSCLQDIYRAAEAKEHADSTSETPGNGVVKLHVGDPYFDPPEEVAEAFTEAVRRGETKYSGVEGLPALREALVEKLRTDNGLDTEVSRVLVSPGSCQGLAALLQSLAAPGAEILLPELHWPVHLQQSLLAGLRPVFYPLGPDFLPDPEALAAAAGPRTRILLLNSPANPTGAVMDAALTRTLLDLARANSWQVISDEAYEHYVFDGEHLSVASLERDVPVAERIVHSTFSFSKSVAMTGYRLGYVAAATEEAADALKVVQEASIIGTSTPAQYAGIAAIRSRAGIAELNRKRVRANRDAVLPQLVEEGLLSRLPAGGWYALADIGRTGMDAETFATRLLDATGVAVVAGNGFAWHPRLDGTGSIESSRYAPWARHLIRIAFCVEPEALDRGVRLFLDFVRDHAVE
ncbi:pyridoxal phosphate-dependent aminotransferase [Streptomyces sp. CA-250714]|uniref:pyridoxal phosphate-dependent aminotransferase n=1 Tax=Streptomyces sp. CA-250714 TaxID=3240060 RepID=UPI003D8DC0BA